MNRILSFFLSLISIGYCHSQSWNELHEKTKQCYSKGDYKCSLEYAQKAYNETAKLRGKFSANHITSINNLALVNETLGYPDRALLLYKKAVRLSKKYEGEKRIHYSIVLNNLAVLHENNAEYEKAFPILKEALAINEQLLGKNSIDYAIALNNFGQLYGLVGQYERALYLHISALEIAKETIGVQSPDYSIFLKNVAVAYWEMGELEKALPILNEVLEERISQVGKDHPSYARAANSLALLYQDMGLWDRSKSLSIEALDIQRKWLGPQHPDYSNSLNTLARYFKSKGDFKSASSLFKQAVEVLSKTVGKQHPDVANILDNLGNVLSETGQFGQAFSVYNEALLIREKIYGKESAMYATSLNNVATLYILMEQYKRALQIQNQALRVYKETLGEQHPKIVIALNNLALVNNMLDSTIVAQSLIDEAINISLINIHHSFAAFSESEKRDYLASFLKQFDFYNSFYYEFYNQSNQLATNAYNLQLGVKGIILSYTDKIVQIDLTGDQTLEKSLEDYSILRNIIAKQYSMSIANRRQDLPDMERQSNKLEVELSKKSTVLKEAIDECSVKLEQVKQKLKSEQAAIEFSDFQFINKRWTDSTFYCAYIIKKGDTIPQQVFLFEQRQLDSLLQKIDYSTCGMDKECVANKINNFHDWDGNGKKLYDLVWSKIEPYLKGVNTVYFSPSGKLHKINFSAIPTSQQSVLSDRYRLVQLNSTRSIALPSFKPVFVNDTNSLALFGGIQYDTDTTALKNAVAACHDVKDADKPWLYASRGFFTDTAQRGMRWQYLPGTKKEVEGIMPLYPRAKQFTGLNATEEAVKTLQGKQKADVLHLATHGFFFKEEYTKDKEGKINAFRSSNDPLIRSGLMLAGGNLKWNGVELPGYMEDGILTAKEVAAMNLYGTKLVVLSACETGLGDIKGSEGVYGLQRAFKAAGAQYLLMSLWTVPDMATAEFMKRFYGTLKEGKDIETSFIQTQQHMRQQYNDPFYWAGFVLVR